MNLPIIIKKKDIYYYFFHENRKDGIYFKLIGNNEVKYKLQSNEKIIKINNKLNKSITGIDHNDIKKLIKENLNNFEIEINNKLININWKNDFLKFYWEIKIKKCDSSNYNKEVNEIFKLNFNILSNIKEKVEQNKNINKLLNYNLFVKNNEIKEIFENKIEKKEKNKRMFSYSMNESFEMEEEKNEKSICILDII